MNEDQEILAQAIRQANPKTTNKIAQVLKEALQEVNDLARGQDSALANR